MEEINDATMMVNLTTQRPEAISVQEHILDVDLIQRKTLQKRYFNALFDEDAPHQLDPVADDLTGRFDMSQIEWRTDERVVYQLIVDQYKKCLAEFDLSRSDLRKESEARSLKPEQLALRMERFVKQGKADLFMSTKEVFRQCHRLVAETVHQLLAPAQDTAVEAFRQVYPKLRQLDPSYFPPWDAPETEPLKNTLLMTVDMAKEVGGPGEHTLETDDAKLRMIARLLRRILKWNEQESKRDLEGKEPSNDMSQFFLARDLLPAYLKSPFNHRISIADEEPPEDFHYSELRQSKRATQIDALEEKYDAILRPSPPPPSASSLLLSTKNTTSDGSPLLDAEERKNRDAWSLLKTYFPKNQLRVLIDYRERMLIWMTQFLPGVQSCSIYPFDVSFIAGQKNVRLAELKMNKDVIDNRDQWKLEQPRINNHAIPATAKEVWFVKPFLQNTFEDYELDILHSLASHIQQKERWRVQWFDSFLSMIVQFYSDVASMLRVPITMWREIGSTSFQEIDNRINPYRPLKVNKNTTHGKPSDNYNSQYLFTLILCQLIPNFPEHSAEYLYAYFGTFTNMIRKLKSWTPLQRIQVLSNMKQIGERMAKVISETFCPLVESTSLDEARCRAMTEDETVRYEILDQMPKKKTFREDKFYPPCVLDGPLMEASSSSSSSSALAVMHEQFPPKTKPAAKRKEKTSSSPKRRAASSSKKTKSNDLASFVDKEDEEDKEEDIEWQPAPSSTSSSLYTRALEKMQTTGRIQDEDSDDELLLSHLTKKQKSRPSN